MKYFPSASALVLVATLGQGANGEAFGAAGAAVAKQSQVTAPAAQHGQLGAALRPLSGFVENKGQWDADVLFFGTQGDTNITLTREAIVLQRVPQIAPDGERGFVDPPLVLDLPHTAVTRVEGVGAHATLHHFFLGERRGSAALGFDEVYFRDLAEGIDVRVRASAAGFAYDVLAEPGARLEDFVITARGNLTALPDDASLADHDAATGRLDSGRLAVTLSDGASKAEQVIGDAWTEVNEVRGDAVDARFVLRSSAAGAVQFGFAAPKWDRQTKLVIDPTIILSGTYIGGGPGEYLEEMVVADDGSTLLTTRTTNGTPVTPGAYQSAALDTSDMWIGKVASDGQLLWATFLGGSDGEHPMDLALDQDGSVIAAGGTWSVDFPTTQGAFQEQHNASLTGGQPPIFGDGFVARLSADGSSMVWSTLYGGTKTDEVMAVAIAPSGQVVAAVSTVSPNMQATPGVFDTVQDPKDQMLIGLSADGSTLDFASFFHITEIHDIDIGPKGAIHLFGHLYASDGLAPTTPGVLRENQILGDEGDMVVAKIAPDASQILWCTYVGGSKFDLPRQMAIDASGAIYLCGLAASDDFGFASSAYLPVKQNIKCGFIVKLSSNGKRLIGGTYIEQPAIPGYFDYLDVDSAGNVHACGNTNYPGWPTTPDALFPDLIGPFPKSDVIYTKFDVLTESLDYSTYLGGSSTDYFAGLGVDAMGIPHIAMTTFSTDLTVTPGAFQDRKSGSNDLYLMSLDLPLEPWRILGNSLEGDYAPNLVGEGKPILGSPMRLAIRGGKPNGFMWIVIGQSEVNQPLVGGVLQPAPKYYFPLTLNGQGDLDINTTWPGFQTDVWIQAWGPDAGAPLGWNATNAVKILH